MGVLGAVCQAIGACVARHGPLTAAAAREMQGDVRSLEAFFVADGQGLPVEEVKGVTQTLRKIIDDGVDEEGASSHAASHAAGRGVGRRLAGAFTRRMDSRT